MKLKKPKNKTINESEIIESKKKSQQVIDKQGLKAKYKDQHKKARLSGIPLKAANFFVPPNHWNEIKGLAIELGITTGQITQEGWSMVQEKYGGDINEK